MTTSELELSADTPVRRSRGRPRKTANERDDGNRRQDLLRAAAHLFRLKGFAGTSTRDIAAAAGMQAGSPFYHFENKGALLAAVMREGMQRAVIRQQAALDAMASSAAARHNEPSAPERLRVLVRNQFDVLLGPDSDFIPVMLYEWRHLSEEQRQEIDHLKVDYEAPWVPVLQTLHQEGALCGSPPINRLMIFGALNWAVQWYDPARAARGGATLDDLADNALLLFLRPSAS
ncbi:MAG: TetR family transcriptional regulator [Gammaproteobacteria bacterium]